MDKTHTEVNAVADAEFNREAEHNRIQAEDELGAVIIPIFQRILTAHSQLAKMAARVKEED